MTFAEMDNCFVRAIRYLHSTSLESQNNIRVLLDEVIKSKYGPGKELGQYVNYAAMFQDYPAMNTNNVINSIESCKDDVKAESDSDNELELDLLKEDLLCVVCKGMGVGARNRLVECSDCHNLYHQECHDPTISDEEIEISGWTCITCKDVQATKIIKKNLQSPINNTSSHKSSPSNQTVSSSKSYNEKDFSEMASTKLHGSKSSSSSSSSSSSKSSSSSNRVVTPNINLVSADKRLLLMKKKAAKMQEKRKLSR